jgi:hypothetical protein
MSPPNRESDRRLGELILYIAQKSATDSHFGDTKLNKLLYFADFLAFRVLGASITGAVYQKLEHGPAPRRMIPIHNDLVARGEAEVVSEGGAGWPRHRTIPKRRPDLSGFTGPQIALIDEVIEHFWSCAAWEISERSHRASVGWQLAQLNEDIPYETALTSAEPPSEAAMELARRRFAEAQAAGA